MENIDLEVLNDLIDIDLSVLDDIEGKCRNKKLNKT